MPHKKRRSLGQVTARDCHSKITPEHIAKLMNISLEKAKQMLKVTTQQNVRTAINPITRRYCVDHLSLKTQISWAANGILTGYVCGDFVLDAE